MLRWRRSSADATCRYVGSRQLLLLHIAVAAAFSTSGGCVNAAAARRTAAVLSSRLGVLLCRQSWQQFFCRLYVLRLTLRAACRQVMLSAVCGPPGGRRRLLQQARCSQQALERPQLALQLRLHTHCNCRHLLQLTPGLYQARMRRGI